MLALITKKIPVRYRIMFGPYVALFVYFVLRIFRKNPIKVLPPEKTLDEILANNLSVIRFGDGEMSLIKKTDLAFQKYNENLSENLKKVLQSNNKNILICVPNIFSKLNHLSKRSYWFTLHHLLHYRKNWESLLDLKKTYGDAFITRPFLVLNDKKIAKKIFSLFKKIWEQREVVLIEGSGSRLGVGNDLFSNTKSIQRILCPSENAYSKINAIISEAVKIPRDKIILLSLGPAAKVIGYELFKLGYRVIDIGHIDMEYEMFLRNSEEITKIDYKYFNEINARTPEPCDDPLYLKQIITEIK